MPEVDKIQVHELDEIENIRDYKTEFLADISNINTEAYIGTFKVPLAEIVGTANYITDSDDVEEAIEKMFASGEISAAEKEEIREMVWAVIRHPQFEKWFSPTKKVKNEAEIILSNGDILRPDRVVFDENEVAIIDFKTGMRKPEHDQQIATYKLQLLEMGHLRVNGLLVYTGNLEVFEV